MRFSVQIPIRVPCPPGACLCEHDALLADPLADQRILRLTREEEKKLLLRLEQITSLQDLRHVEQRMYEQLGIRLRIAPGAGEVRTVRGIQIEVQPMRGLCSKTRQSIPAAIRRGMDRTPEVAFELLDEGGLFG
ncbi:Uncharacterised protein [Delftia tsuruhatensis]|uniref:hypothetical protein n=1 Tax=Delftia tsuruhatensis TaxID=180282 RepID=UPI001E818AB9|nr:hypothetical protein [Delftia tsuruhatensis]CAB5722863.1 Uncharacterised protein [Delftia tsuruhatensis]CAC9682493.1 Uncharacterised protein [Delftia tsuruhatensis]